MSLAEKLVEHLEKSRVVVSYDDDSFRILEGTTPAERLAALCAEIDETFLARKLTFGIGANATLSMDVGGRRLMRILEVSPAQIAAIGDADPEKPDASGAALSLATVGKMLAVFCFHKGPLRVKSEAAAGLYPTGAVGFTRENLFESAERAGRDAATTAAPMTEPIPKPDVPAPNVTPAEPPAKFSPTAAMKAMIRDRVNAATTAAAFSAAANPGPVKAAPVSQPKKATAMPENSLRAFFDEIQNAVTFCAILNAGGNVELIGGKDTDERILAFSSDVIADLDHWRETTTRTLSSDQMIVLKANGIQNQSLALFSTDKGAVIAVFANTDLSRIFAAANKTIVAKSPK